MHKIDAHQHFWTYDPHKHSWINNEMKVLKDNFLPPQLKKELDKAGVEGCVAVQADQSEEETKFLLKLAKEYDFIKGVVGWLDIQGDHFEEQLQYYKKYNALKGLRHVVQDEPDDEFLLKNNFLRGIEALGDTDLTYDLLIHERHLPVAVKFISKFPSQKFVLDHIAKPKIKNQEIEPWKEGIMELAQHPNTFCKVSGLVTEADWNAWEPEDFKPYFDIVFEAFGVDRLMFGSDWPVCKLAASYTEVITLLLSYINDLSDREKAMILGGNAIQFYNL